MHGKDRCFPVATVTSKPTSIKDARRAPTSQATNSAHAQGRTLNRMMSTTSGSFKRCLRNVARRFFVADALAGSLRGTLLSSVASLLQCVASIKKQLSRKVQCLQAQQFTLSEHLST